MKYITYCFSIIIVLFQIFMMMFLKDSIPIACIGLDILCIMIYIAIIVDSFKVMNIRKKRKVKIDDDIRILRHDFNNIMQAIGGYIKLNDFKGLKVYYEDLLTDHELLNNTQMKNKIESKKY